MAETDKELTILAAKAAGIEHPGGDHSKYDDGRLWDCKGLRWWNPLKDDADALRLAVQLGINVNFGNPEEGAVIAFDFTGRFKDCEEMGDPMSATRRAIVRAAAAISRTQEQMIDIETLEDGARVRLHPNSANPLHKKPIEATYQSGYFYCDGSDPIDGPDYYVGDVLALNDDIEVIQP